MGDISAVSSVGSYMLKNKEHLHKGESFLHRKKWSVDYRIVVPVDVPDVEMTN